MKKVLITVLVLTAFSCAPENKTATVVGKDGKNGSSCSVSTITNGAEIFCTDGTFTVIHNGDSGLSGNSCTATSTTGGVNILCGNSPSVFLANGEVGSVGATGDSGKNSLITQTVATTAQCANGGVVLTTFLDMNSNGLLDSTDTNVQQTVLCNGTNGLDGKDSVDSNNDDKSCEDKSKDKEDSKENNDSEKKDDDNKDDKGDK